MTIRSVLLAGVTVLLLATGCGPVADGRHDTGATPVPPDLVGTVTEVSAGGPRRLLVEEQPGVQAGRKAWVTLDPAAPNVLVGATVEVWISGPCAESYPEQCSGAQVRIR